VAFNDVASLDQAVTDQTAGVILEVVQGESGVHLATPAFLSAAEQLCRDRGALLIIDEIQTGFGRTGRWFAIEHAGLAPDIVCLAKGLGGGFPMGATAYTARVRAALHHGAHGSTFGGSPLACAAGLAAIETYRGEQLIEQSATLGTRMLGALRERLADVPIVREVRGLGLMIAIELRTKVAPILKSLMLDHHVIALPAGPTILRLLPPLVITEDEIAIGIEAIAEALTAASSAPPRRLAPGPS
jgi:acetylornithine/LysW-gamma-L-lysine aminotransferase